MPKIIDTLMFFNEVDVLKLRLSVLYDKVDKFLIVEANNTHLGENKDYIFEKNQELFSKYADKIIYKKISLKEAPGWPRENENRYVIASFLNELDLSDDDIILCSDCDEIPNLNRENIIEANKHPYCYFNQLYFIHYINMWSGKSVTGTVSCKYGVLKMLNSKYTNVALQVLRNSKDYGIIIEDGGWHYSYCGGSKTASEKSRAIAEGKTSGNDRTKDHYDNLIKQTIETRRSPYSHRQISILNLENESAYLNYSTAVNGSWVERDGFWQVKPNVKLDEFKHLLC